MRVCSVTVFGTISAYSFNTNVLNLILPFLILSLLLFLFSPKPNINIVHVVLPDADRITDNTQDNCAAW